MKKFIVLFSLIFIFALVSVSSLPNSINYHSLGKISPVKDQGSCGSCWAFASVALVESNWLIHSAFQILDLSEQELVSCNNCSFGCQGGMPDILNYIRKFGVVEESCMPYGSTNSCFSLEECAKVKIPMYKIEDPLGLDLSNDTELIKKTLVEKGPLVVGLLMGGAFPDSQGIYRCYEEYGAHAVLLVGYQDDPSLTNGGYWIIKNSWGSNWQDSGYFKLEYGYCRFPLIGAYYIEGESYSDSSFLFQLPESGGLI